MIVLPNSLRIGVLRGGVSSEYNDSLKSGANALKYFGETHRPVDIFISRDGKWIVGGVEKSPERVLKNVDVIWNALHGSFGEDGGIQELLYHHGVPFTGSDKFTTAVYGNKWLTKERAVGLGIRTPVYMIVRKESSILDKAKEIWNSIIHPMIIKPATGRSGGLLFKVDSFPELVTALESVLSQYEGALVEEYISGQDVSCFITDDFRGQDTYAFPPTENLSRQETIEVEDTAKSIHEALGLRHYSKSDFVVSPRRGVYFLEVNTVPKLNDETLMNKSFQKVGVPTKELLHHMIGLALDR